MVMVAGLGFRAQCNVASLRAALNAAINAAMNAALSAAPDATQQANGPASTFARPITLTALATAADKATHPALLQLAAELQLPITPIKLPQLASQAATPSKHVPTRYGAHSVAEAAALAAAAMTVQAEPVRAQLLTPRCTSPDRMATAAIASTHNTKP
jgi:cobalt-precorrin 5A hydrolase